VSSVQLNLATTVGAKLGSDTVGGIDYQKEKIVFGTDGVAPVSVDALNPLPVTGTFSALPNATTNITQFGGTNIVTGTGSGGAGIPRVTVSNDSLVQLWDGTTGPVAVKPASTAAVATDKALVVAISPNNSVAITGTITTTPPSNASTNLTQVAGATLGATAVTNFGTAPAAAAVPGVNASMFSGVTPITNTGGALNVNVTGGSGTIGTVNQGNAGSNAQAWWAQLGDTARGPVTVKAASTAAVAADVALVVAISPNNVPVLPLNAAQETGGNLASIAANMATNTANTTTNVTQTATLLSLLEIQREILAVLRAIRMQAASSFGVDVDPSVLLDVSYFN
jgi:hypothetical protein